MTLPRETTLTVSDIPEIRGLLDEIWAATYGDAGSPVFTDDYLEWLYGGPMQDRHLLIGYRATGGRLVGFRAFLFRQCTLNGPRPAYIATHATVRQDMPRTDRLAVSSGIGGPLCLGLASDALLISFYEAGKPLARRRRTEAEALGHSFVEQEFAQHLVNLRRLAAWAGQPGAEPCELRPLCKADMPALVRLSAAAPPDVLAWTPDPHTLWHHVSGAAQPVALAALRGGDLVAGLAAYVMTARRSDGDTRVLVCDRLIGDDPVAVNTLMRAALDRASALDCRGVVVENATGLAPEIRAAAGLVQTSRRMLLTVWSVDAPGPIRGYAGDVK